MIWFVDQSWFTLSSKPPFQPNFTSHLCAMLQNALLKYLSGKKVINKTDERVWFLAKFSSTSFSSCGLSEAYTGYPRQTDGAIYCQYPFNSWASNSKKRWAMWPFATLEQWLTIRLIAGVFVVHRFRWYSVNQVMSVRIRRRLCPTLLEQVLGRAGENLVRRYVRNHRVPLTMEN